MAEAEVAMAAVERAAGRDRVSGPESIRIARERLVAALDDLTPEQVKVFGPRISRELAYLERTEHAAGQHRDARPASWLDAMRQQRAAENAKRGRPPAS